MIADFDLINLRIFLRVHNAEVPDICDSLNLIKAAVVLSNNGLLKPSALPMLLGKNIIPEKNIEKI
jgi:hypothetical protein